MLMAVTKKSPTPLLLVYILKPNRFQSILKITAWQNGNNTGLESEEKIFRQN